MGQNIFFKITLPDLPSSLAWSLWGSPLWQIEMCVYDCMAFNGIKWDLINGISWVCI